MLKLLVDENLSFKLVVKLEEIFKEVSHVVNHGLSRVDDNIIWHFAKETGYTILTKDNDYKFMSVMSGCPPKVVRLRCGNESTSYIVELIKAHADGINQFFDSSECYMEIL